MNLSPGARGGWSQVITTVNLMRDIREQPTMEENARLGAAKAHRQVPYSHYEYRNVKRSSEIQRARVTDNGG